MTNISIQIISDTVCPWCYIGLRRLTRAITTHHTTHPSDTFTLTWHPYYLNPQAPSYPGVEKRAHYAAKFGEERARAIFARLTAAGEGEGIAFRFSGRTGRTRDSHRVLWYAGVKEGELRERERGGEGVREGQGEGEGEVEGEIGGLQTRVAERLFRAYFEEEKNITDRGVLVEAAAAAGLDGAEVERFLEAGDEGGKEVDLEAERARHRLVTGVPYFTVQGQYAVEGADEPETFLEVFEKVKQLE